MSGLYAHHNRTVSSVWYIVLIFVCVVGFTTWRTYLTLLDIEENNQHMVSHMRDIMALE